MLLIVSGKDSSRRGLSCCIVFILALLSGLSCKSQCTSRAQLNEWERGQFVEAAEGKREEVRAQFLSAPGCSEPMVAALSHLGAKINFWDRPSGYALITLSREKLFETLDIAGIDYAYTSDNHWTYYQDPVATISLSERRVEPVPAIGIPYPRVATTLAPDGPYFAADEIGLSALWKRRPEADGRGVRVGIPDEGFDLLHPALEQARDAAGNIVHKVADLGTSTSPDQDSSWIPFGEPVESKHGVLMAAGRSWTVPKDGTYRFGIFKQDLVLGPEGNSRSKKLSLSVGVLWDQQNGLVWVDTDGDGSFKNQHALGDYGVAHEIDWFGTELGKDDNRIPFGVKIDTAKNAVYLRIGGDHGALVAGPLAANTLTGGLFDGAAPSAQLIDWNYSRSTELAALVSVFSRPDVDMVNVSGGIGRVAFPGYSQEGYEDFPQRVLERIITVYNKPIAAYSAAAGTIHVMDYDGPEMLRRNQRLAPPYRDTVNSFVWNLPSGLVNTVLAPSANLVTESRYMPLDLRWDDGTKRGFTDDTFASSAPDGYSIGWNMSPTIPVMSGVLADLISEAKREHVRYNATRLNNAVFTGTRLLEGFPVSQQGYGLINAAQSWDQLAKMAKADDPANPALTSFTVSRMEDGRIVEVQGFHADLPNVGEKLDGEIWITRHGGYAGGRKYTLALRGNDGSYELLDHQAVLERDKAVRVRFRTNGKSGWNIVFLELRDAKADVVMQDVPLSVRVPDIPEKVAPGVDKYESTIQPLGNEYRYVRADDDTQAARYVMRIPYTGTFHNSARSFPGFSYRQEKTPPGAPVDGAHHVGPMEELRSLVANGSPGTQEIFWENRGRPEYATQYDGPAPDVPIHATLTVTKYALVIAKTERGTLSVRNQLADAEGHIELYDAKLATSELKGQGNHAMAEVERDVPAGLAEWRVLVTGSAKGAHADAYLFNCTGKDGCVIVSQQEIMDKRAPLVVEKPQAGTWRIIVRSREQMDRNLVYKLSEAQLVPTQAWRTETDTNHRSGEKWSVALPSTTRYAGFRIAGTPGVESEKDGLLIAMTPLEANVP